MQAKIFAHTWEAVVRGEKTVTSRIALPTHEANCITRWRFAAESANPAKIERETEIHDIRNCSQSLKSVPESRARIMWHVGASFGVKPARCGKSLATARVLSIIDADVRLAKEEWANAEGFGSVPEFWATWAKINKLPYYAPLARVCADDTEAIRKELFGGGSPVRTGDLAPNWHAWKISFRVEEIYEDKVAAYKNLHGDQNES